MLEAFETPSLSDDPELQDLAQHLREARLEIPFSIGELERQVAAMEKLQWLIKGLWRHGEYGVLMAPTKSQKTYTSLDLLLSVASGKPWLNEVPVEVQGPAIGFFAEGGKPEILTRLRGVAADKGISQEELRRLPIGVLPKPPILTNWKDSEKQIRAALLVYRPKLVIIDPLYSSIPGADTSNLASMSKVLFPLSQLCEGHDASLFITHHDKKSGGDSEITRGTGVGVAEWARVAIGSDVKSREEKPSDVPGFQASRTTIYLKRLSGSPWEHTFTRDLSRDSEEADSQVIVNTYPANRASTKSTEAEGLNVLLVSLLSLIDKHQPTKAKELDDLGVKAKIGAARTIQVLRGEAIRHGLVAMTKVGRTQRPTLTPLGVSWLAAPVFDRAKFQEMRDNHPERTQS